MPGVFIEKFTIHKRRFEVVENSKRKQPDYEQRAKATKERVLQFHGVIFCMGSGLPFGKEVFVNSAKGKRI